jgi:predicted Zn-dependent protease
VATQTPSATAPGAAAVVQGTTPASPSSSAVPNDNADQNATPDSDDHQDHHARFLELAQLNNMDTALHLWRTKGNKQWLLPVDLQIRMAFQLVQRKQYQDAYHFIDSVLADDPNHVGISLLRAKCFLRENQPQPAQDILDLSSPHLQASADHITFRDLSEEAQTMRDAHIFKMDI